MVSYTHYIHFVFSGVGFFFCTLLLIAIAMSTPKALKAYSILIFYCAFNDFLGIAFDTITMERLMVYAPTIFWEAIGPCVLIGADFCNYCNSIFCVTIIESTIIQCISFWYRNRILSKPCPGALRIHTIVFVCSIPNIINAIVFKHVRNDGEAVKHAASLLYPEETWQGAIVYGLPDVTRFEASLSYGYFFLMMPILFTFMIYERRNVLKALIDCSHRISEKTMQMHKLLIKILTLHSIVPLMVIFACVGVVVMALGYHHPEMEALYYLSVSLPPILNPAICLWSMRPYREFAIRIFFRGQARQIFQLTAAVSADRKSNSKALERT